MENTDILALARDKNESSKRVLFGRLVKYAKSLEIAVVVIWSSQKDYSSGRFDSHVFTSNGYQGSQANCVFCGRGPLQQSGIQTLDGFVADSSCFSDHIVGMVGSTYLPATNYRPAMIIQRAFIPGSLDDNILHLAWAISCHELGFHKPSTSPRDWEERADAYGEDLAGRLWEEWRQEILQFEQARSISVTAIEEER